MVVATTEGTDGVLVSTDAGTPSALPERGAAEIEPAVLEALEFPAVLERVAALAAGPLGAASIRGRRPVADRDRIAGDLALVDELVGVARESGPLVAEPVPDLRDGLARLRIEGSVLEGGALLGFRRTLAAARLVTAELRRVRERAPRAAALECPLPDRAVDRALELALDDSGELLDTASRALAQARADVRRARERLIGRLESILRSLGGSETVTLRDGRYVIPVPRELRRRPDGIVHGESASGATLYLEPTQAIPLGNELREAEARAEREALNVLRELTGRLRPYADLIDAAHAMCVAVDDLAARAAYAVEVDGHRPEIGLPGGELRLVRARHPLLLSGRTGEEAVPFDLALEPGERTVILSGPNAGGKSVLLKAAGLVALLAQSGIIPPLGPASRLPVFRRVYADIGDRQSIAENLSTFTAHLLLLRDLLKGAGPDTLVLLDEIGTGTDPTEGAALAGATLLRLTRLGATTLATTHLGALKQLAARAPGVVNASLDFDPATLTPTYHLTKGVPGRSYGLVIARKLGLPADVLAMAEEEVPEAERRLDLLLAAAERRAREVAGRETAVAALEARIETEQRALAEEHRRQSARAVELAREERELARRSHQEVRRYLLEARERVEQAITLAQAGADESAAHSARRMVEQAVEAEARALEGLTAEEDTAPPLEPSTLAPGDPVRLESGARGQVLELRPDGKAVVALGDLRLVVAAARLVRLTPGQPGRPAAPPAGRGAGAGPEALPDVDLRGLTGDEAEQTVVAAIDAAVVAERPFLRIIHGKGTGVVRERVQQVIRRDRRVKAHSFAPPAQGGTGVTLVELG
jgi:DNA mismatch repair protein MutS2